MTFYISLTHSCQLRCDYCYSGEKFKKSITHNTLKRAIDFIFSFNQKNIEFGFFGGEPLLEWSSLVEATLKVEKIAKSKDIHLKKTLTTNAIALDSKKCKWLREHNFFLVISLDGNESMHNTHRLYPNKSASFKDVVGSLGVVQNYYNSNEYCVNVVVTKSNIIHMCQSVKYLYNELRVKKIKLNVNIFDNWDIDTTIIENEYKNVANFAIECYSKNLDIEIDFIDSKIRTNIEKNCNSCNFGEHKFAIAPSGTIYPCERLIGEDTKELSIGDVYSGIDYLKQLQILKTRGNTTKECQDCSIKDRCLNDCGCSNYYLTGSIDKVGATLCYFQTLMIECADIVATKLFKEKNRLFLEKFYK